jgi:hypothetical protein
MAKLLKWVGIIVGALMALIVALLLIVPWLVDFNKYKARIEHMVTQRTGRYFSLGGDMDLSLFPWVGFSLSDVHLGNAEGFKGKDFVSVDLFEVRVKLIPLIFRDVQVKRFILKGPRIVLEKDEGGRANWEGLLKSREGKEAEKRLAGKKKPAFAINNLMADEFAITSGELVWIDHRRGTEWHLTGVSFVVDGISFDQPVELEFSGYLNGQPLKVKGEVGPLGRPPGKGKVPILFNIRALDGFAAKLQGFCADQGSDLQFKMSLEVQPFSPRKLAKAVGLDLSNKTRDPDAFRGMSLKATISGTTEAIALKDGLLKLDDSTLTFSLDAREFEKPALSFNFDLDSIDLDRYLPFAGEAEEKGRADAHLRQKMESKPVYPYPRKLVMNGAVRIGSMKVRGADVSNVNLTVNAENGNIRVAPCSMTIYGGSLLGFLNLNLQEDRQGVNTSRDVKGIPSRILMVGREMGISSLECEVHGSSIQIAEMLTHLEGLLPPAILDWRPRGEMIFDLSATAKTGHDPGSMRLKLDAGLQNGAFSTSDAIKRGEMMAGDFHVKLEVPAQEDQPVLLHGELGLEAGRVFLDSFTFDLKKDPFRLHLLGEYDPKGRRASSLSAHFRAPALEKGSIVATLENHADPRGKVHLTLGPISNQRAIDLFVRGPFGHISPLLRELSVKGETSITAAVRGSLARYSIQGLVETSAVDLAIPAHELRAEGLRIRFPFSMEFPEPGRPLSPIGLKNLHNGLVHVHRIKWKSHEWVNVAVPVIFVQNTLLLGRAKIPMWGGAVNLDGATIRDPFEKTREITLRLRLDQIDLPAATKAVSPAFVQVVPSGSLEGTFSEIKVSEDGLVTRGSLTLHVLGGRIEASNIRGRIPFSGFPEVSMKLLINDIILEQGSFGPFLPVAILNWKLSGAMALDVGVERKVAQASEEGAVHLGAWLRTGAFSSPDDIKLGEGIQGEIHVELNIPSQQDRPASFQGDLILKAGEVLWGPFYLNFQQDPFRMRILGVYDAQNHRLPSLAIQFNAPTLGQGNIRATVENLDHPQGEVNLSLGPISNRRAYELFVREPFGHVSPALKDTSINGETRITASIRGSLDRYRIQGVLDTSADDLTIPAHKMKAKGVRIQLPVSLRYPEAGRPAHSPSLNDSMKGFIKGGRIQWESQEWRDLSVPLTLEENTLFFSPRIELPLWGGTMVIEGARIHDPFGKTMEVTLGLRLEGLDLSELTKATIPFALPGSLESDFPEIRISGDSLATRGNLTIHALGGQIEVRNIQGDTPFSRLREVSMDVFLREIDLEEVSRVFEFGQMGGVIEGWVRGLAFSFGQPEKFELEIRSVKKRGVKQYINAEAVNDLSILSSGKPFSFRRGVLRIINYFPYAELGIYCKLENDVFTLRGTIHEKGGEYLIKRGPFRGIDVINRNPENRIRWKQMLGRLKSVSGGMEAPKGSTQK